MTLLHNATSQINFKVVLQTVVSFPRVGTVFFSGQYVVVSTGFLLRFGNKHGARGFSLLQLLLVDYSSISWWFIQNLNSGLFPYALLLSATELSSTKWHKVQGWKIFQQVLQQAYWMKMVFACQFAPKNNVLQINAHVWFVLCTFWLVKSYRIQGLQYDIS